MNNRLFKFGLIGLFFLLIIMSVVNIEVKHYDSPDSQYSVITKESLIKYLLPSFPTLPGDGTSFKEGKVILRDNKKQEVIDKYNFYVKVRVEWKIDTVKVEWNGFVYSRKLPRPIVQK